MVFGKFAKSNKKVDIHFFYLIFLLKQQYPTISTKTTVQHMCHPLFMSSLYKEDVLRFFCTV